MVAGPCGKLTAEAASVEALSFEARNSISYVSCTCPKAIWVTQRRTQSQVMKCTIRTRMEQTGRTRPSQTKTAGTYQTRPERTRTEQNGTEETFELPHTKFEHQIQGNELRESNTVRALHKNIPTFSKGTYCSCSPEGRVP